MNVLMILILVFNAKFAVAGGPIYCFKPGSKVKASKLQFNFPSDGQDIGKVKYQKGKTSIEIKRLKEIELGKADGRPSEIKTTWIELPEKASSGIYTIVSQGAVVKSLEYRPAAVGSKAIKFKEDTDAAGDHGCDWNESLYN